MPSAARALACALALTAGVVGAGVALLGGEDEQPAASPAAYDATPLASYDTSTVEVLRSGFCDRIPAEAVTDALGAEVVEEDSYGNGDRAALTRRVEDVAHEYGCRLAAGDAVAWAWVFAPPVTVARARELTRLARQEAGCVRLPDAEEYGDPSVALLCGGRARRTASYRGLFGDAWLACSLSVPAASSDRLQQRLGPWCVAVAEAASSGS